MSRILPQVEQEGKCADEWCSEPVFRDGLCLEHFVEAETQAWDDHDAEWEMALECVGYVFGDPVRMPV